MGHHDAVLLALALKIPFKFLGGLVLLGFIAAVTSTMDSSLNVGSLTLTRDLYQGFLLRVCQRARMPVGGPHGDRSGGIAGAGHCAGFSGYYPNLVDFCGYLRLLHVFSHRGHVIY